MLDNNHLKCLIWNDWTDMNYLSTLADEDLFGHSIFLAEGAGYCAELVELNQIVLRIATLDKEDGILRFAYLYELLEAWKCLLFRVVLSVF